MLIERRITATVKSLLDDSPAVALLGPSAALLFLAAVGLVGVVAARRLPDVSV